MRKRNVRRGGRSGDIIFEYALFAKSTPGEPAPHVGKEADLCVVEEDELWWKSPQDGKEGCSWVLWCGVTNGQTAAKYRPRNTNVLYVLVGNDRIWMTFQAKRVKDHRLKVKMEKNATVGKKATAVKKTTMEKREKTARTGADDTDTEEGEGRPHGSKRRRIKDVPTILPTPDSPEDPATPSSSMDIPAPSSSSTISPHQGPPLPLSAPLPSNDTAVHDPAPTPTPAITQPFIQIPTLPTATHPDNQWLVPLLELCWRSFIHSPALPLFTALLTTLIRFNEHLPIFSDFLDYSRLVQDPLLPRYDEDFAFGDLITHLSSSMKKNELIRVGDSVSGTMGDVSSASTLRSLFQRDADLHRTPEEAPVMVIDIPLRPSTLSTTKIAIPDYLRESSTWEIDGGKPSWRLIMTPAGNFTHTHIDFTSNTQLMVGVGDVNKLWLICKGTPENLGVWGQFKYRPPTSDQSVKCFERMSGWQMVRQTKENPIFVLPSGYFHCVLTFTFSFHLTLMIFNVLEWDATRTYMNWSLKFIRESRSEIEEEVLVEVKVVQESLNIWIGLAKKMLDSTKPELRDAATMVISDATRFLQELQIMEARLRNKSRKLKVMDTKKKRKRG